jgi:hypothetical protein
MQLRGNIVFYTGSAVERGRITSGGFFKASVDGTYLIAAGYHELNSNAGAITVSVTNTNAPPQMVFLFIGAGQLQTIHHSIFYIVRMQQRKSNYLGQR